MSLERFESHLREPAPGFRCYECSDRDETISLLARVKNQWRPPLTGRDASKVRSSSLRAFYELHDGIVMYRDTRSTHAGIVFFPFKQWAKKAKEMHEWMDAYELEAEEMPSWFREGVVFGEIHESGNYFVLHEEHGTGRVYYYDHDDFQEEPLAESFEAFLALIVDDPPGFLFRCGCYTRYSDGKTEGQWIPKEYVSDSDAM